MIKTHSKFWYGWEVTEANRKIDFIEPSDLSSRVAVLRIGKYSSSELCDEIKRKLSAEGALTYQCSFDRLTKKFTISTVSNFGLLANTGPNGSEGVWDLLGYSTASDYSGASSYTAQSESCIEYTPQFKLQGASEVGQSKQFRDATYSRSSAGVGELSHFGTAEQIEHEIRLITDILQPTENFIRNDPNGKLNAQMFLDWARHKALVEFMPDENDPLTFHQLRLMSTEYDSNGLGFSLIEDYQTIPNYFRSGKLRWEVVEL